MQYLAQHCFIDIGSVYYFIPPPKDDFGEKPSGKMQLSQVGT